jgi:hypothetical protein
MEVNDLHRENPIVVNTKGEILDGQHRYEARKLLEKQVYYIISGVPVSQASMVKAITTMNSQAKNWVVADYLNSYIKQNKVNYLKLKVLVDKYPFLSISQLVNLVSSANGKAHVNFKNGTLDLDRYEQAEEIAYWVVSLAQTSVDTKVLKMTAFINAIKALIGSGKVTLEDLIKKISLQPKKVVPSTTVQAAIENLLSVYNYKSRAPIGLSDILTKARLDRTVSNQLTIEEKRKGALTASAGSFGS